MKVAVLPFNAAEGTAPALGRQFSNFACDTLRAATGADLNPVSFLAQIEDPEGPRAAFVNLADSLLEQQMIDQMFGESGVDLIMDGLLKRDGDNFDLTVRYHFAGEGQPRVVRELKFSAGDLFKSLHGLVKELAGHAELTLPEELNRDELDFGTDNPESFLLFLEGYDAVNYIQQANGAVAREFQPKVAMDSLLKSLELDPDFIAPYEMLVQLCRMCAQYRLGEFPDAEASLKKLTEFVNDDYKAYFALGELYQSVNNLQESSTNYEKAVQLAPEESALYSRLGMVQLGLGMPVNAERNFRKAVEMEAEDKPSMDLLANVLQQTGRVHEIPPLWKDLVDKYPQNPQNRAKYAISLIQAGKNDDGIKAFEEGIEQIEDNLLIKRYYAPVLAEKGDSDRAMDYYEDCLDVAPNDIQLLLEYANVLQAAGREVDLPRVLRDVLGANPDPNTRAQTLAWLIELEQPRRVEVVEKAREKMEQGDFAGAIGDLRPLKNWLGDYWKLHAVMSSALNQLGEAEEAEESVRKLLDLFPGCEPAYGELNTALNQLGRHDEAYNIMRFAAMNMPQSLGVHVNLALAASRAGHQDEATALAKQIREAVGPNQELEAILGEIDRR